MQNLTPVQPAPSAPAPFLRRKRGLAAGDLGDSAPRPSTKGTVVLLIMLFLTWVFLGNQGDPPKFAAYMVGIGLLGSVVMDYKRGGVKNLIRADLFALLALYFITLFEFVFPQDAFNLSVTRESVSRGIMLCIYGFAGVAIGRHITNIGKPPFAELFTKPVPTKFMLTLFWFSFFVGYMHMLVAVNFNVVEMWGYWIDVRFSQPWQRGRLGDVKALLIELGLFLYLLPPLAGIIVARRHRYSKFSVMLICLACGMTLFYGFSSGTRNIFASFVLTFLIGYSFAVPERRRKELYVLITSAGVILLVSTVLMLEFRQMGLKNYVQGQHYAVMEDMERTLHVDYNLYAISQITEVFPTIHDYLGWEVPYIAIIRPIPRAIWKGKPEGLSMSIEDAVGAQGWTVAASFIGEAYLAGGPIIVFVTAIILGILMGWWGHLASPRNSEFGILVYASGFFAAAITMRSLFVFTTAILPTLGALVIGAFLLRNVKTAKEEEPSYKR